MVLRILDLTGQTATINPSDVTESTVVDPVTGAVSIVLSSASGVITSGTMAIDLSTLPLADPAFQCAGNWADQTGLAKINFPAWQQGSPNPTPAGALLVGVLAVQDGSSVPFFPTGVTQIPNSPQKNLNGSDQAFAFTYVCQGNESGTQGGNNPTSISIQYEGATSGTPVAGTNAAVVWEIWANAALAASAIVSNPSSPAAFTHPVPQVTTPGGPVVYAVVGRTSSHAGMGAHSQDTTDTTERVNATTTSTAVNNMGGVIYDEANVAAGTTPNRQATTTVGAFTVGVVFALQKVSN